MFFHVWKVFLNKHLHFRDIYPLHSITDWGKCSARRFFCSDSWNNSKNNTSRHSLLRNSGGRLWIRGEMILNSLKAGSSSRPLCMINRNQIPLLTIRSALFCFHLPPSSALLSLWNPLYLAVPPTPHPAVSACPRFTAPPPPPSLTLSWMQTLALSVIHPLELLLIFSHTLQQCLLLIPAQLANTDAVMTIKC